MTELRASTGLPDDRRRSGLEIAGLRIALIATAIIALIRLHHIALSDDVAFLAIAAERLASGGKFGSDLLEMNTPAAVLLYLPIALLHRAFDWRIDHIVPGMMITVILALIFLAERIVSRVFAEDLPRKTAPLLSILWVFVLALPAYQFGQRDHLVIAMILPYLAITTAAEHGCAIRRSLGISAGCLIALAIAVKPHYVLVLPMLWWPRLRSDGWRAWLKASDVRAVIVAGLLLAVASLLMFPEWIGVARFAVRYYDGMSLQLGELIGSVLRHDVAGVGAYIVAVTAYYLSKDIPKAMRIYMAVLLRAAPILVLIFFIQKKGFAYHLVPFDSVSLVAATIAGYGMFVRRRSVAFLIAGSIVLLMTLALLNVGSRRIASDDFIKDPVVAAIAANDRGGGVTFLSTGLMPAIQTTILSDTKWGLRSSALWPLLGLKQRLREAGIPLEAMDAFEHVNPQLVADAKWYRRTIIDDLVRYRPDVVLVLVEDLAPHRRPALAVVDFLSGDAGFQSVWSEFSDAGTLQSGTRIYQFMVRKPAN
jgi:hypothetical protein